MDKKKELLVIDSKTVQNLAYTIRGQQVMLTETWRIVIDIDEDEIAANEEADAELIAEMVDINTDKELEEYHPMPEEKAPEKESKGRKVPARSKKKSENALARARYCCEVGNHETFDFSTEFFGAILQYPGKYGQVYDYAGFIAKAAENEIKVAVAADILSLAKLTSPGEMGAAVVVVKCTGTRGVSADAAVLVPMAEAREGPSPASVCHI